MSEQDKRREVFLQSEGKKGIELRQVATGATVDSLAEGSSEGQMVFVEGRDEPLAGGAALEELGLDWPARLHVHRCTSIAVSINYGSGTKELGFAPARTIGAIRKWAISDDAFNIAATDAADLVLQVCDSQDRPDDDTHIGTLTAFPACKACFDLVPRHMVEG